MNYCIHVETSQKAKSAVREIIHLLPYKTVVTWKKGKISEKQD